MKIKLTVHDIPEKGYLTLDPAPQQGPAYKGSIVTLEGVVDAAEVTELLADSMLDYIPARAIEDAVRGWCKLLRHGGRIILGGTNANEIARLWINKQINTQVLNQAVFY
jgi:hypothetical protein